MNLLKNLFNSTLNLLFPRTCLICNKMLNHSGYTGICINCYKDLELFNITLHPELSNLLQTSNIDSFNAPFIYSDNIAKIILNFKFHDQEEKGVILANLLNSPLKQIENFEDCLLIPVPIHKKRLLKRKYNQATILAKTIAKNNNLEYSNNALKRVRHTPHQTGVSKTKRKRQLRNSFLADSKIVENKSIILIDDVFTTGTTTDLCAKELKNKGASKVHVLTIAYTAL